MLSLGVPAQWKLSFTRLHGLASSAGAMLLALTYGGVLPANAITTRGHEVGGALLVVLLSLALARKLKSLQEESELLATELLGSPKNYR